MRKVLCIFSVALGLVFSSSTTKNDIGCASNNGFNVEVNDPMVKITAHQIKQIAGQAWTNKPIEADFDKDKMTLTVREKHGSKWYNQPYTVRKNPYQGYDDDMRGSYTYCASNYYFNY